VKSDRVRGWAAPLVLAAACLAFAPPAAAQIPAVLDEMAGGADSSAKLEELRGQIDTLEKRAAEWAAKASEYQQALKGAPAQRAQVAAEISALKKPAPIDVVESTALDQIEVQILSSEQDLALAQREVAEQNAERDRRSERRRQLPDLLADAKSRLSALGPPPPPVPGEDAALTQTRRTLHEKSRAALAAEVKAYEQELLSFEERGKLLDQQILRASLRVTNLEQRLEKLREIASERRQHVADREVEQALGQAAEAGSLSPAARDVVRRIAEQNAELARIRTGDQGLRESIDDVSRKLANIDARLAELDADYERLTQKVASSGLTDSLGILLRRMRSQAPDVGKYRRFIRMRQSEIGVVQSRQEELRDELARLSNIDKVVASTLERFAPDTPPADRAQLESVLRDLFRTKQKHLTALLEDYETLFQKLVDYDSRQQQLIEKTENLVRFIDARVLWIPSGRAARWRIVGDSLDALQWLASPKYWLQVGHALWAALLRAPSLNAVVLVLIGGAFPIVRKLRPRLAERGAEARAPTETRIAPTLEALLISLVSAPWGPAALAYVAWRLEISTGATLFVRSVAHGLSGAALIWFTLELPRQILRRDGLAEAHFAWPETAVRELRREITWLAAVIAPLVFLMQTFEQRGEDAWRESIGRLAFMASAIAMTAFTHRILREGGALRAILDGFGAFRSRRWVARAVYAFGVAMPAALTIAAASGYYWTALQLGASYHLTLVYLFLLLVVLHLALRWSLILRRRLAFEQWRKEREEALEKLAEEREKAGSEIGEEPPPIDESEVDLGTIDVHTGRLLSTSAVVAMVFGLWFLWADLVPAIGALDTIDLWSHTVTRTVEVTAPDGSKQLHTEDRVEPITLANAFAALITAFMTWVLVRNLPGLLEISLYRRLGTAPGERYAYTMLTKYAISVAGGVLAFNTIGIDWSQVQWLVAAVGLGLGFGLQEIFANFVSGLIILFERPMRVGDSVVIGNLSGTVTRIRIRATWLVGGDRKEIVVPNKQFVTNHLINASLSDPTIRVDVPVGIAYGSDTERAMRELLTVAEKNERVLRDPKPSVMFLGFGESGLNFALRAFSDISNGDRVQHEMGLAVERAFREAGIEIPLPQREVHVRSAPSNSGEKRE
jgi:potassium-dependent mechanosensitive channel